MKKAVRGSLLVVLILAVVASCLTWKSYFQRLSHLARYQETTGTIVGTTPRSFNASVKPTCERRVSLQVPLVEYSGSLGPQRGNPIYFSAEQSFSLGDRVVVYFDPEQPGAFLLSSRSIPPTMPVVLSVITLVFAALAFRVFKA